MLARSVKTDKMAAQAKHYCTPMRSCVRDEQTNSEFGLSTIFSAIKDYPTI